MSFLIIHQESRFRCLLEYPSNRVLPTIISEHLRHRKFFLSAINFLAVSTFCSGKCLNSSIIEGICYRIINNKNAEEIGFVSLMKLCSIPEGASLLLSYPYWLELPTIKSFKIFMALFAYPKARQLLIMLGGFPKLLTNVINLGDPKYLKCVSSLLHRIKFSRNLLIGLATAGFIRDLAIVTRTHASELFYSPMILIMDVLGRAGNAKDFIEYPNLLYEALKFENTSANAISVIALLSQYPQCAKIFKKKRLESYFLSLKRIPDYNIAATRFLTNMQKCS